MAEGLDSVARSGEEAAEAVRAAVRSVADQGRGFIACARASARRLRVLADRHPRDVAGSLVDAAGGDARTAAAAAALADVLELADPALAGVLVRAQWQDSARTEWVIVRALYRMSARYRFRAGSRRPVVPELPGRLAGARLPDGVRVCRDRPASGRVRAALIGPGEVPMRAVLAVEGAVRDRVVADPRWGRLVLCLYGGVPIADSGVERAAALARLAGPVADRERAAALADDAAARAFSRGAAELDLDAVTVDSPLTPDLVGWLRAGVTPADAAQRLRGIAADSDDSVERRADAVVGVLALAEPGMREDLVALAEDSLVRARVRWRLERALVPLVGAASRMNPGAVVDSFRGRRLPGPQQTALDLAAVRTLSAVTGARVGWGGQVEDHLPVSLVALVNRDESDTYNVAVALDTVGAELVSAQGAGLATMLSTLPAVGAAGFGDRWLLDPLAPAAGHPLAETLTAISRLDPELVFLRCWVIDRLAVTLKEEQFAVEAACMVLLDRAIDPVSTERSLTVLGLAGMGTAEAVDALSRRLIPAPYPAGRARIWLTRLCGDRLPAGELRALAVGIADPGDALRLLELAADLRVADPEPELAREFAGRVASPAERARALGRTARLVDVGGAVAEALVRIPEHEAAHLLGALPGTSPVWAGRLAEPMLVAEREYRWEDDPAAVLSWQWTVATAVAVCADAAAALGSAGAGVLGWTGLLDERRTAVLSEVERRGAVRPLGLTSAARDVVDRLLADGRTDVVLRVLPLARLWQRDRAVRRWRQCAEPEVADLATLLALEVGDWDADTVAVLPRLLGHDDERVRERATAALVPPLFGAPTSARVRVGAVGPALVAELARQAVGEHPRIVRVKLRLMLSAVEHDSPGALPSVLDALEEDNAARSVLLRSVRRMTPLAVGGVADLVGDLPGDERALLLAALVGVARAPRAAGLARADLAALVPVLAAVAENDPGEGGQTAVELLGLCDPTPDVDSLATEARDPSEDAAGAVRALGHVLGRSDVDEDTRARAENVLRELARGDGAHAVAAVAALVAEDRPVASLATDPLVAVRGLLAAARPGRHDFAAAEPLARLLDAADVPESLLDAVAAAALVGSATATLGLGHLACLRSGVLVERPHVLDGLLGLFDDPDTDAAQFGAVRALAASGVDLTALLPVIADSRALSGEMLAAVARSGSADAAAVTGWCRALDAPAWRVRHLALRVLSVAVEHGLLDTLSRAAVADALDAAAHHEDADRPVTITGDDGLVAIGTFGDLCRETALDCRGVDPLPVGAAVMTTPYDGFRVRVPESVVGLSALGNQMTELARTRGWARTEHLRLVVDAANRWSTDHGVPLIDVLEALVPDEDGDAATSD